jgi:hypothetical protein
MIVSILIYITMQLHKVMMDIMILAIIQKVHMSLNQIDGIQINKIIQLLIVVTAKKAFLHLYVMYGIRISRNSLSLLFHLWHLQLWICLNLMYSWILYLYMINKVKMLLLLSNLKILIQIIHFGQIQMDLKCNKEFWIKDPHLILAQDKIFPPITIQ